MLLEAFDKLMIKFQNIGAESGELLYNDDQITKRVIGWTLLIGYSGCLIFWMFFGFGRTVHAEVRINYVPLKTILHFMNTMNTHNLKTPIVNLAGNIGVFVPFGVMLPYIFAKVKRLLFFSIYFISAIMILETLQALLKIGTGDVDDVIFNYLGGLIGFGVYRWIRVRRKNGMIGLGKPDQGTTR